MGRTRRRLLVLTGVVVVAAGGAAAWWLLKPAEASTTPVVVSATVGTQRQTVSASGTIEPAAQADLNFSVSGEVTQVLVKEGDQVTTGQALATVDDTLLQAQLTAAQASLDAAEDKESSDDSASAQAAVVSAESDVTAAQEAVDNATLKSTIDGTVVTVGLKVGDRVSTGSSGGSGGNGNSGGGSDTSTTQFTVVSTNTFVVDAKVGSSDIAQVKQGMAAEVTATGATEAVDGTVQTVGLVASADDSGAATFPVTIAVTGEQKNIYAGSSATVSIVVEERQNVLTVPALALHTDGNTTYVNKMVDGKAVRTNVKVGASFGPQTEIVSGLKENDQIEVAAAAPTGGGGGTRNGNGGNVFPGGGFNGGGGGFQGGGGNGGFGR